MCSWKQHEKPEHLLSSFLPTCLHLMLNTSYILQGIEKVSSRWLLDLKISNTNDELSCNRWVWIGVGYLIGAIIVLHIIIIAAQRFLGPLETSSAVLSEEALRARDIALFGQSGKGDVDDSVVDVAEEVQICSSST